jgi:hypothetical protein
VRRRVPGLLDRLTEERTDDWIDSMRTPGADAPPKPPREPVTRRQINCFTDEDLAELISREPDSAWGQLALSVLRVRESWRTPARWALVISAIALAVSLLALIRGA